MSVKNPQPSKSQDVYQGGDAVRLAVRKVWTPKVRGIKQISINFLYMQEGLRVYRMNVATDNTPAAESFFFKYDPVKDKIVHSDPPFEPKKNKAKKKRKKKNATI